MMVIIPPNTWSTGCIHCTCPRDVLFYFYFFLCFYFYYYNSPSNYYCTIYAYLGLAFSQISLVFEKLACCLKFYYYACIIRYIPFKFVSHLHNLKLVLNGCFICQTLGLCHFVANDLDSGIKQKAFPGAGWQTEKNVRGKGFFLATKLAQNEHFAFSYLMK